MTNDECGVPRNRSDCSCRVIQLTPDGRGALGSLLVEGQGAMRAVTRHFQPAKEGALERASNNRILYGRWRSDHLQGTEEVVVCRCGPEKFEVHCHGGQTPLASIVESLCASGCRCVPWQEWLADGEDDRVTAAARVAMAKARTERTATILMDQYLGALREQLDVTLQHLARRRLDAATGCLQELILFADVGRHLVEPWQVVLVGRPNVGKSSLFNALLGYRRAIVNPASGTTRDVVTATTALDGWPVQLADTAGIRPADNPLESAGMERARQQLEDADLVILVSDRTLPWSVADDELVESAGQVLIVHNKYDLDPSPVEGRPRGLLTSAHSGIGVAELADQIHQTLVPTPPLRGAAVPFTDEQNEAIRNAIEAIQRGDGCAASDRLQRVLVNC